MSEELIRAELETLNRRMALVEVTLREVRDLVISTPRCPQPGLCLQLSQTNADHEARLRAVEKRLWIIAGACVVLNLIYGAGLAAMKFL